jgi:hypothetical protein
LEADNQIEVFVDAIFWDKRNRASKALNEFRNYTNLNEVFIEEQIATQFKKIGEELASVLVAMEVSNEIGDGKTASDSHMKLVNSITPNLEQLGPVIRRKFFERV